MTTTPIGDLCTRVKEIVYDAHNRLILNIINGHYEYLALQRIFSRLAKLRKIAEEIENIANGRASNINAEEYNIFLPLEHRDPEFLPYGLARKITDSLAEQYGEDGLGDVQANCFFPPNKHDGNFCGVDRAQDFFISWVFTPNASEEQLAVAARRFFYSLLLCDLEEIPLTFSCRSPKEIEINAHFFIQHANGEPEVISLGEVIKGILRSKPARDEVVATEKIEQLKSGVNAHLFAPEEGGEA